MKYLESYNEENKIDIIGKYLYEEISEIIECKNFKIDDLEIFYEMIIYYKLKLFRSTINILYEQIKLMKILFDKFSIYCDFDGSGFNSHLRLKIPDSSYKKLLAAAKSKKFNL
jgi:hypothetical protein